MSGRSDPLGDPLLTIRGLRKRFGGVQALDGVDLDISPGEVHGLIGENGAGKSTLLKILSGAVRPDSGEIRFAGRPLPLGSPRASEDCGIRTIYQDLTLVPSLTCTQNIFLGQETRVPGRGGARRRTMRSRARVLLRELLGSDRLDPDRPIAELSLAERQMVEIARALSRDARLVLMDEPTGALTPDDAARLHAAVRELQKRGVSVVYVSHRLEEVVSLADRITVLRDGRHVETLAAGDATLDRLIRGMVGRSITERYPKEPAAPGELLLELRPAEGLSVTVHAGEVVGLAGLVGAGRTELVRALFGVGSLPGLAVRWCGRPFRFRVPRHAIAAGIGMVPEDRQQQGLVPGLGVAVNIGLPSLSRMPAWWLSPSGALGALADRLIAALRIRASSASQPVRGLSGGNQQKVVLAKWLAREVRLLILDEPTRGIDVGAKQEMYRLMNQMTREGRAVLLISSDLPEVLAMSDRVYVMRRHRVVAEPARSPELVMAYATGAAR